MSKKEAPFIQGARFLLNYLLEERTKFKVLLATLEILLLENRKMFF